MRRSQVKLLVLYRLIRLVCSLHLTLSQSVHTTFLAPVQYFYGACLTTVGFDPPVSYPNDLHTKLLHFYRHCVHEIYQIMIKTYCAYKVHIKSQYWVETY